MPKQSTAGEVVLMTPSPTPRYIPALVLIIGVILSVISTLFAYQQAKEREQLQLDVVTERIRADAIEQLGTYVALVRSTVGFFEASNLQVSAEQFRRFLATVELKSKFPSILAMGYVQRVSEADKDTFERAQQKGRPEFRIFPDNGQDPYFAVTYVEPSSPARDLVLGYDPLTDPTRLDALTAARDTGTPVMTGRVILKTEQASATASPSFVIYAPIYNTTPPPLTTEARRKDLQGYISASLRVDDLLEGIREPTQRSRVAFRIFAGTSNDPRDLLMTTPDFPADKVRPSKSETISIAGFSWTFEFVTLPGFDQEAAASRSAYIALVGILLSVLLYGLTSVQAKARRADERALHHERGRAKDLQDLDQAKTRFFSNLSHELRTPLNGILGMTDLLWDTPLNEEQKDFLTTVGTCGRTLLDLISDVLDVSKIEAGKLELKIKPFRLRQPFSGALEVIRGQARGKDLELKLEWDESLPRYVEGDLVRMRQVLVNLLSNAVKFTRVGTITVRVKHKFEAGQHQIAVEVEDTGIGISEENLKRLFHPFSQVAAAEGAETIQGTGLGLVICKELAELMGGSITLSSQLGVGTVFRLNLPIQPIDAEKYESVSEPRMTAEIEAGLRLLVVDDNPVNLRVLLLQLHKLGYSADGVDNGLKALEAVKKTPYDLILMDCQMPVMDGLEATRRIRLELQPGPIVIALTAHAQPEQQVECEAAGMDDFMTKPIEFARLVGVLDKWRGKLKGAGNRSNSEPTTESAL